MEDEILAALQMKWERKLLETRVADFARAPGQTAPPSASPAYDDGPSGVPGPGPSTSAAYGYSQPMMQGPGMALPFSNGVVGGDVRVKNEPEDILRVRGGGKMKVEAEFLEKEEDMMLRLRGGVPDIKPEPNAAGLLPGDEVIDSDLDDSDDEGEEEGDIDIVFCVYDKVQRVKNKWKTVFKEGVVHINGKDYLFAKCNGEFEW
ncbi:transcription factor IIA, alpha/beta subunit-domain-containing protein [Naematelia encephala]|uniref:Transcription factor IIA, alpha/beta subunit-domain-containing protein n=1 Tax=Naematelia encephala TaxID=71784 RepID=A0A1Y2B793_9TREE|nr:transcription factor IIA, alpha/beta subunit-domain-containing protein [Naematelia encephala]